MYAIRQFSWKEIHFNSKKFNGNDKQSKFLKISFIAH